jgi:hypothetical protein
MAREHDPGPMLSRDERRHAAQRLLLLQTGTQGELEALVLSRELRGMRLRRVDSPIAHRMIVPRMRGAGKSVTCESLGVTLREFDAQLQKGDNPGAWTCVVMGDAAGKEAGDTVRVRIDERIG